MKSDEAYNHKDKQAASQSKAARDSGQRSQGCTKPASNYTSKAGKVRTK